MSAFDNLPRCAGGCGQVVAKSNKWCISCWPADVDKAQSDRDLRFQILNAAYKLALGNRAEREAAIPTLSHLITVLQHETLNPKKP